MHKSLENIRNQLNLSVDELHSHFPYEEPFSINNGGYQFPGLSKDDLIDRVQDILNFIDDHETDDLGEFEDRIADYVRRLEYLRGNTIVNMPNDISGALPAFQFTLDGLQHLLLNALPKSEREQEIERSQTRERIRRITNELRGMEAQILELKTRTGSLDEMVVRIERAHSVAHQLPTDMQGLEEAKNKVDGLAKNVEQEFRIVSDTRTKAEAIDEQLEKIREGAVTVLENCHTAYTAATSEGLATAFAKRSSVLARSIWFWVASLFISLGIGIALGWVQLGKLSEIIRSPEVSESVVALNMILAILSVGAPIWFAWLSTKQIGQRFRLSEDYGYKASISHAYEGFRREAARIDPNMEAKLLGSALTRLDELPLRLVEQESHGSPWQELLSSDVVRKAMQEVPDFSSQVKALAGSLIGKATSSKEKTEEEEEPSPKLEKDN